MENYISEWHMSPALSANGFLFLTGMTGAGPDGSVDPDPQVQINLAFERVNAVLKEAGSSFADLIEMTSYHVGLRDHIGLFRNIRDKYISEPYPAWTAIEVAGFVTPGTLVELRVVARAPT